MSGSTLGICASDFKRIKPYDVPQNWVGPREEASYVSFWNQTVVVLVNDLDNASCERAFVVVMYGCGLRVEKGSMIMK